MGLGIGRGGGRGDLAACRIHALAEGVDGGGKLTVRGLLLASLA